MRTAPSTAASLPAGPPRARALMWLLRDVTLPALRQQRLRACLTLLGVVVGVQLVTTIQLVNRATLRSFERTFATLAGDADLQLTNGDVGVSDALIESLATDPGVASVSGLVRGTVTTAAGPLTVFGVDLLAEQALRERQFPRRYVHLGDELRFVNAVDSIALSTSHAAAAGLALGDGFEATGPAGTSRLVVRGTLDPVGPATLFGGAVGLVDLPTAQRLFARDGRVDEIDVLLAPDADRAAVTARLGARVAGAGTLAEPTARLGGIAGLLGGLRTIFAITTVLGATVGTFLVHHAIRSAVLQRRRALAIARALGYRRALVAAAVLVEATAFGLVGALLGAVIAVGAARLAIDLVMAAVGVIWTSGGGAVAITPDLGDVGVALLVGVGSALVAAAGPALAAARIEVVEQLRTARPRPRIPLGFRTVVAGVAACGLACLAFASAALWKSLAADLAAIAVGSTAMTIGYATLAPLVLRAVVLPVRRWRGAGSVPVALAAEQLARDPVRCRGTLGALMAAFAFVLCVTAFVRSLGSTIVTWMDQALAADFFVGATPDLPLPSAPTLPADLEAELAAIPGVADATPTRITLSEVGGRMVGLKATRVRQLRARPFPVVAAEPEYLDAYARGESVLVSDNLAFRLGLRVGDHLALDSATGRHDMRVGAVIVDYTIDVGTVTVETEVYRRRWRDAQVSTYLVHLAPSATAADVRARIAARFAGRRPVSVLTAAEFKRATADAIDAAFALTYAIQLVAACVAAVGVLNFFLAEVVDRRREIGLLRTVALDRRQLVRTLVAEAALVGIAGGVLALAWGVADREHHRDALGTHGVGLAHRLRVSVAHGRGGAARRRGHRRARGVRSGAPDGPRAAHAPGGDRMTPYAVELRSVEKRYARGARPVEAVRGISFAIGHGEFVALMGPSGSGKSTLLNLIAGLDTATSGEILLDGIALGTLGDDALTDLRRTRIGVVFQLFNLLPSIDALENAALPLRASGIATAEAHARAERALATVGLADRARHLPEELSGGEMQRVAIARALAIEPTIILADEPTGSLDSDTGRGVLVTLRRCVEERGVTVLLVTHDAGAAGHADRVIHVRDGLLDPDRDAAWTAERARSGVPDRYARQG